jgi:hypothetical protein
MGGLTRLDYARAGVALPGLALALATVTWLAMAVAGRHPFWPIEQQTLSEAVASRDFGEVARLLAEGQDPNARYAIRAGLVGEQAVEMTPLEAAAAADLRELVPMLVYAGAVAPTPEPPGASGR